MQRPAERSDSGESEGSPTLRNILEGNSKITLVGEGGYSQARVIGGKEWDGVARQYELVVPSPLDPKSEWRTYLTVWQPRFLHYDRHMAPDTKIFITTGRGEMPFSESLSVVQKVLTEIERQTGRGDRT